MRRHWRTTTCSDRTRLSDLGLQRFVISAQGSLLALTGSGAHPNADDDSVRISSVSCLFLRAMGVLAISRRAPAQNGNSPEGLVARYKDVAAPSLLVFRPAPTLRLTTMSQRVPSAERVEPESEPSPPPDSPSPPERRRTTRANALPRQKQVHARSLSGATLQGSEEKRVAVRVQCCWRRRSIRQAPLTRMPTGDARARH